MGGGRPVRLSRIWATSRWWSPPSWQRTHYSPHEREWAREWRGKRGAASDNNRATLLQPPQVGNPSAREAADLGSGTGHAERHRVRPGMGQLENDLRGPQGTCDESMINGGNQQ